MWKILHLSYILSVWTVKLEKLQEISEAKEKYKYHVEELGPGRLKVSRLPQHFWTVFKIDSYKSNHKMHSEMSD